MSRKTKALPLEKTFIQVTKLLLQSDAFTHAEKFFISYIITYETDKTVCYESNNTLSFKLNMGLTTVKDTIQKLEDMGLLVKFKEQRVDEKGNPFTYRELRIRVKELNEYLYKAEEARDAKIIAEREEKRNKKKDKPKKKEAVPSADQQPAEKPTPPVQPDVPVEPLQSNTEGLTKERVKSLFKEWLTEYKASNDLNETSTTRLSEYMRGKFYKSYMEGTDTDTRNQVGRWLDGFSERVTQLQVA